MIKEKKKGREAMRILTKQQVEAFKNSLALDEKSKATIQKYMRDVHAFYAFTLGKEIEKERMIAYKRHLLEQHYAVRTVNSMLCSINQLMHFLGWEDCIVKGLRLQRQTYQSEQKELTKAEYHRLLRAAEHKPRLQMILKTIGCTGIRVSELQYFTVESVKKRKILISCKGKIRTILLPSMLQKRLLSYCRQYNIHKGLVFCTRSGKPLDRSNIWTAMKKLCAAANVSRQKVFPHNLRKLFARTFYCVEKDIARLADILGHSSIETTRIYIMTTERENQRILDKMNLLL